MENTNIRIYQRVGWTNVMYFTPSVLLDHTSATSFYNEVTQQHQMSFYVEMWTEALQEHIADSLRNLTGDAGLLRVSILPFDRVVISSSSTFLSSHRMSPTSYSFSKLPKRLELRIGCDSAAECDRLAVAMRISAHQFAHFTLHFVFDDQNVGNARHEALVESRHVMNSRIVSRLSQAKIAASTLRDDEALSLLEEVMGNVISDVDGRYNSIIDPQDTMRLVV